MRRILTITLLTFLTTLAMAQPQARRQQQQQQTQKTNANNITTRAKIAFPTTAAMSEDVVWRRDIYREMNLEDDANAGLYYPVEPVGSQMNLFTYLFKLMMTGNIKCYEYRLDGNESFEDSARVKPLNFLDNYHIYYERNNGKVRIDNSDIPSSEVKGYYIKESAYYDQGTATFHRKVIALCPIMMRMDDFGDGATKYPLFWVKYDDVAPFLSKQTIMTSNINNAATMSIDDFFTLNKYKGKIYKTTNMLGRTLAQYCPDDSTMAQEQRRIEQELIDFERNIFGDQAKKDSLDSIAKAQAEVKTKKEKKVSRRTSGDNEDKEEKVTKTRRSTRPSATTPARVSVRRERH
ncbi:MAG: gliding motility protein GldN [Prevotella sp.]|jgi:gliding motility associated protien GldN|nr:gliding motility protein GldN [Prevotella sp.]